MNRLLALLVMLVAAAETTLAGEPTPAQRSNRAMVSKPSSPSKTRPRAVSESTRKPAPSDERLIGAGVVRRPSNPSGDGDVRKASAVSRGPVVNASSQVIEEGIPYDEGVYETTGGEYIVDEGMPATNGSCTSCGDSGCDGGSCGIACGPSCSSGWGGCGIDLCNPGRGPRRQLCICLPSHGWAQLDYLSWWQEGMQIPALLTTSTTGTSQANAGVLGLSSTTTLLGDEDLLTERMNGGRLRFGWWFANNPNVGVELEYFGLKTSHFDQVNRSTGTPILARPFFNIAPETGLAREDSELVAFPSVLSGSLSTSVFSTLDGAAVRFRRLLCCSSGCGLSHIDCGPVPTQSRIDATLGWRFLQLNEGLGIREDLQSLLTNEPGSFVVQDSFQSRSQFNGVETGVLWQGRRGYWSLDALMRCSIGNTRQEVIISGSTATTQSGNTTTANGGLLAQRTNSGTFTRNTFGVVPEWGATLGYQCTQHWRLTAGYTFIYWSNVVRPGDQIDTDVNPNLLPPETVPFSGAARPRFAFQETDYWVQGVNLGAEYRW